jgi:hypothetical protein
MLDKILYCSVATDNRTGDPTEIVEQSEVGQLEQHDNRAGLHILRNPEEEDENVCRGQRLNLI